MFNVGEYVVYRSHNTVFPYSIGVITEKKSSDLYILMVPGLPKFIMTNSKELIKIDDPSALRAPKYSVGDRVWRVSLSNLYDFIEVDIVSVEWHGHKFLYKESEGFTFPEESFSPTKYELIDDQFAYWSRLKDLKEKDEILV